MLNVPFCPIKQKLRKKQSEVSMVKIPQHKVTKSIILIRGFSDLRSLLRSFEVANKGVFGFYGAVLFMTSFGCVWLRVSLVTMVTIN